MDFFPYTPRRYQPEVMGKLKRAMEANMTFCLQAPTGFGKTTVVLSTILKLGHPLIWVSRTGNTTDRPVQELKIINEKTNSNFFGMSFRGKTDMCPLTRTQRIFDRHSLHHLCKKCDFEDAPESFNPNYPMTFSEIYKMATQRGWCPYKLQKFLAKKANLVSMSYNYVFSEHLSMLSNMLPLEKYILVVDEAHNLQKTTSNLNSEQLTLTSLQRAVKEAESIDKDFAQVIDAVDGHVAWVRQERHIDAKKFMEKIGITPQLIGRGYDLSEEIYKRQMERHRPLGSYIRSFSKFFDKALSVAGTKGTAFIESPEGLELFDMRSAEILKGIWGNFHNVILVSGTLKPMKAFTETVGLGRHVSEEIPSFTSNVFSFVTHGVTTRGMNIGKSSLDRYRMLIHNFFSYPGNIAVFNASYRIQSELESFFKEAAKLHKKKLFVEDRSLRGNEAADFLEDFKSGRGHVLIAPMGGRFGEGVDFPGTSLEGIMLIGVPFDRLSLKTKLQNRYYEQLYGRKGRDYAYVIPAFRRASQAVGRAIRAPEDFGFFVLADERYAQPAHFDMLPDYIQRNSRDIHYSNFPLVMRSFF
ncbi:MAG: ATP-dependent DNA helicase [Candidatus Altiarchaeota archaeon]|nr:ATP-dependent DNA helicase [Candidatus Altiarchaeota archaeon]